MHDLDEEDVHSFDYFSKTGSKFVTSASVGNQRTISQAQALGVFGAIASIEVSVASRLATELSSGHIFGWRL